MAGALHGKAGVCIALRDEKVNYCLELSCRNITEVMKWGCRIKQNDTRGSLIESFFYIIPCICFASCGSPIKICWKTKEGTLH